MCGTPSYGNPSISLLVTISHHSPSLNLHIFHILPTIGEKSSTFMARMRQFRPLRLLRRPILGAAHDGAQVKGWPGEMEMGWIHGVSNGAGAMKNGDSTWFTHEVISWDCTNLSINKDGVHGIWMAWNGIYPTRMVLSPTQIVISWNSTNKHSDFMVIQYHQQIGIAWIFSWDSSDIGINQW